LIARGVRTVPVFRFEQVTIEATLGRKTWHKTIYVKDPVVSVRAAF
jgi:hypothetical protein